MYDEVSGRLVQGHKRCLAGRMRRESVRVAGRALARGTGGLKDQGALRPHKQQDPTLWL